MICGIKSVRNADAVSALKMRRIMLTVCAETVSAAPKTTLSTR